MKILITGISGFVGGHLTEALLKKRFSVCGFDREEKPVKGATTHKADLTDKESVLSVIKKESPNWVIHLAGQSSVDKSFEMPELTKEINVGGTKNLLDALFEVNPSAKVLVVSSAEVYGVPQELPINESHVLNPGSPYGESRVEQEKLCFQYVQEKNMHIVVSRSFNHTGPRQPLPFVCPTITKQVADIKAGKVEGVELGNPAIKRDFSDVRDIVNGYILALEKGKSGEVYNLCSGKSISLKEIIELLEKVIDKKISIKTDPSKTRKIDIPELCGDHSKFTKDTGWNPKITFEDTLKDMVEYWEKESS